MATVPNEGPGPPGPGQEAGPRAGTVAGPGKLQGFGTKPRRPMASAHLAAVTFQYPEYSLLCLRKRNPIRSTCVLVSHTEVFERFILFCILCNCVTLGMSSNRLGFSTTRLGATLSDFEYLWVAIFTVEALLKIISMGFVLAPGTYLRDGWNVVDFAVVVLGYVDIFMAGNLTALRTVRVLRPLRAVTRVRAMRTLVSTLLGSMPMLLDVFALCAFTFFIYGLIAVQLFAGSLQNRCGAPDFGGAYTLPDASGQMVYHNVTYVVSDDASGDMCSGPMATDVTWYDAGGVPVASPGPGGAGQVCPTGTFCTAYGNPNFGLTSFDNIIWAWLTIFQCITQEAWTDVLYAAADAVSWWVWPFFVALLVFGSFYMLNLALAVLYVQFLANHAAEEQRAKQEAAELEALRREAAAKAGADAGDGHGSREKRQAEDPHGRPQEGGNGGSDAHGHSGHEHSEDESDAASVSSAASRRDGGADKAAAESAIKPGPSSVDSRNSLVSSEELAAMHPLRRALCRVACSKGLEYTTMLLVILNTCLMCVDWYGMPAKVEQATDYTNHGFTLYFLLELILKVAAFGFARYFRDGMNVFDCLVVLVSVTEFLLDVVPTVSGVGPLSVLRAFRLLRVFRLARSWRALHSIIRAVFRSVISTFYLLLLTLLFLFIAALMGMQLFGYKFMFCDYVAGASPVCPLGLRVWGDCPDHFYCYLPCDPDQLGSWVDAPGSLFNGLAYCERFCAGPDAAQAAETNATAAAVAAAGGCEYLAMVGKSDVPRAHFDNLFWGMFTVFQLLTTENWNSMMYDAMRSTTPWAAVYFIAVLLIGTYLVFNLFVAILLDNFSGTLGGHSEDSSAHSKDSDRGRQDKEDSSHSGTDSDPDADLYGTEGYALSSTHLDMSGYSSRHQSQPGRLDSNAAGLGQDTLQQMEVVKGLCDPASKGCPPSGGGAADPATGSALGAGQPQAVGVLGNETGSDPAHRSGSSFAPRKGLKRKVLPIDPADWPEAPTTATVTAAAGPTSRPGSAKPAAGGGAASSSGAVPISITAWQTASTPHAVRMAADVLAATAPAAAADGGQAGSGLAPRMRRSLMGAAESLQSIMQTRRNEHLAKHIQGRALLLFGPDSGLRWRAARLVHDKHFEWLVLLLIAASSVTLALDTPSLQPSSRLARAIHVCDFIFCAAFGLEAVLKIVTFGFAFTGKYAYIRNGWNVLDFIIVLVGFALLAVEALGMNASNLQMLRVLRTLRALRPLRAASRYEGLKLVVNTLFAVLPSMANVALVCLLFYLIFAILAVNLFKGQLYACVDAASGERLDPFYVLPPGQTLTRAWCQQGSVQVNESVYTAALNITLPPYTIDTQWANPRANFDNIGSAILSLFQVATLELWLDIAYAAVDTAGEGRQPLRNNRPQVLLYFALFIVVCSFFVLNLFVGVTLEKFMELRDAQSASSVFVTPQQRTWVAVQKLLLQTSAQPRPARPDEPPWREWLYDLVTSASFGNCITAAILVNVLFMAMVHAGMSSAWQDCMSYTNLIFTVVFLAEAILKLLAFGARAYFRDGWNLFDFFVVVTSIVSVALDFSNTRNLSFMPVLRVLRIVRVIRIIRRAKGLQRLLVTLIRSLPALGNVGGVMLLFFFVYSVIGMNLFGGMKQGDFLNRHANFNNFPNAILVLMRMLTGESWDGIMQDCMATRACVLVSSDATSAAFNSTLLAGTYLDPGDPLLDGLPGDATDNQCALSPAAAVIYFPTFVLLCGFILLNLIIAVILENMVDAEADEGLPVSKTMLGQFVDAWSLVDPAATGIAHASQLPAVIGALDPPLGTRQPGNNRASTQEVLMSVDIPIRENITVTFVETLHALAGRIAGAELPDIEEDWLVRRFARRLPAGGAAFPKYTAAHFHAAVQVRAAVRGFMARHKLRGLMQEDADAGGAPCGQDAQPEAVAGSVLQ